MNTTDTWVDCYWRGWGEELVPEAFSHPAKVSFPLAARIYAHIVAEGWAPFGSAVIDPFAGIGGFAYHALFAGLNFVGVELEEKFVALGNQNIALWNARYGDGRFAKWGTARIVRGDSRHLLDVVGEAGLCVSSPPYADRVANDSQRTIDRGGKGWREMGLRQMNEGETYGTTPGQLGAMPEGSFDAAIASPPYVSGGHHPDQTGAWGGQAQSVPREVAGYGQSDGQLGQMPEGAFAAAVSSPPYERSLDTHEQLDKRLERTGGFVQGMKETRYGSNPFTFLSINPSGLNNQERHEIASQNPQIGSLEGDSFWSAARLILAQTYAALRPGGEPVADGEGIEFCDCE